MLFILFSCPVALPRIFSTILDRIGMNILVLFLTLQESTQCFIINYDDDVISRFCINYFYEVEEVTFYS